MKTPAEHLAGFRAELAGYQAAKKARLRAVLATAGAGSCELIGAGGELRIVTPLAGSLGAWRVTLIDDRGPVSHSEHGGRLAALAAYCGFWSFGPPYGRGPWHAIARAPAILAGRMKLAGRIRLVEKSAVAMRSRSCQ